ncbi:serine carboxypeptidase [Patellaria atrata CBS 101060]|uniref:Carboxypeptidase n=1 Tax=Patellaria atrata CBS 101060 TaxID=1346257 RepID=A0A9P4SDY8_9PEZI|nr:serine carboxypeptidase [Patellaria atrata CBS 101060]
MNFRLHASILSQGLTLHLTVITGATLASIAPSSHAYSEHFRRHASKTPKLQRRDIPRVVSEPKLRKRDSPYLNSATEKFVVNGSAIPEVPFDIGESYAGLLPISDDPDETRKIYFWFFPSTNPNATDEVTLWFNGGPGCSSLSGLLTENGPFTWEAGTLSPVQNPYSWTNLTNMLWVEQPIGVGFTQGEPNIRNEEELGQQFIGFYKQFVDAFQVHGHKVYLTGESYAGFYVPYIADAFIKANDTDYYNLKGIAINDPILGDETNQQEGHEVYQTPVVIVPYVDYFQNIFYLNDSFMEAIHARNDECNYTDYLNTYLTFPPPEGPFPVLPDPFASENYTCDMFDSVYEAELLVNPCFNIYHITETCPHPFGQLGIVNPGDYQPPGAQVYFNRSDVQEAINAPPTNWMQCTDRNVFNYGYIDNYTLGDTSLGPAQNGVLQRVIEFTNNTIIGSGNLDMLLNTNGTLLAIQNMTWNGVQGLQEYPGTPFYVPFHPEYNGGALSGAGVVGYWGAERGLTFYQVQLAGHELPGFAPGAGYRQLELLLGRISSLGEVSDFTTQTGNFTGNGTIYKRSEDYGQY